MVSTSRHPILSRWDGAQKAIFNSVMRTDLAPDEVDAAIATVVARGRSRACPTDCGRPRASGLPLYRRLGFREYCSIGQYLGKNEERDRG